MPDWLGRLGAVGSGQWPVVGAQCCTRAIQPNQTKSNLLRGGGGGSGQWPVVGGGRGRRNPARSNPVKPSQTQSNRIQTVKDQVARRRSPLPKEADRVKPCFLVLSGRKPESMKMYLRNLPLFVPHLFACVFGRRGENLPPLYGCSTAIDRYVS